MPDGEAIMDKALRAGINYVDTAPWYGQGKSEEMFGKVLKKFPRESFFISTKVSRDNQNV